MQKFTEIRSARWPLHGTFVLAATTPTKVQTAVPSVRHKSKPQHNLINTGSLDL